MSDNWPQSDPNWRGRPPYDEQPENQEPIVVEIPGPAGSQPLDRFWVAVKRLPRYIFLGTNLVRDDRVPKKVKAMVIAGGIYAVSPIDLVPGLIPVAGQLDDLLVLLLSLRTAIRSCDPEVAQEHLQRAGIAVADFDNDMRAARDTAVWLAKKGARATRKWVSRGTQKLRSLWPSR
jgi:uncharacterized membrane protein YkvA (DUF1232 family)